MSAPRTAATTFGAWSCTVRLVVGNERVLERATADLVSLLDRVDAAASRFRPDSDLSIANGRAGRPTPVSRLTVELVAAALDAAAATDGAVDPTVGPALRAIGYDRDITEVVPGVPALGRRPRDLSDPRDPRDLPDLSGSRCSWREVALHREFGMLTVPAGGSLDLGSTAKSYTADRAAQTLHARYQTPVLVEIGGDLAVAGCLPGGWPIRVAEREGGNGQTVTIAFGGVATSTTTVRRWRQGGTAVHHIIDPRTGAPADGPWRTVSVYASTVLAANTASTAAIVLGSRALPWLSARGIAARLVDRDGDITTIGAWPSAPADAKAA